MTASESVKELGIELSFGDSQTEEDLDSLTRALRRELLMTDAEDVRLVTAGEAPEGVKAGELTQIGSLIVRYASPAAIGQVIHALRGWLSRDARRSARFVIGDSSFETTGIDISTDQLDQQFEQWIRLVEKRLNSKDA